jgi:hypothetical protein
MFCLQYVIVTILDLGAFIGARENFRLRQTFNNPFSVSYMFSVSRSRVCKTMDSDEATVTELEDARVHRVTHCCQFLPSCRFRVHNEVTHTRTQRMKVV